MSERPAQSDLEAEYRLLVEQVPAITYMAEPGAHGQWFYVSPQISQILGFSPQEWMADPEYWRKQIHPDDLARALKGEETLRGEGDRYSIEYRLRARDGKYVWVRDEARFVREARTGRLVMRGLLLDLTERKRTEEELHTTEQRLQKTIN